MKTKIMSLLLLKFLIALLLIASISAQDNNAADNKNNSSGENTNTPNGTIQNSTGTPSNTTAFDSTSVPSDSKIVLNTVYSISLGKKESHVYSLKVAGLQPNQSLFIQVQSPFYDPYQIPEVIVTSDNNFERTCSEEDNQYVGICQIYNQNLSQNKIFNISVKCFEKCSLQMSAILSAQFNLDLGGKIKISALKNLGTVQQIAIKVPQAQNFTDIELIAKILNKYDINEGVEMYVNVGDQTIVVPQPQNFMFKSSQVWGNDIGVFLSSAQVKAGQWIKILLVLGVGVNIQFYSQAANGNTYEFSLNSAYNDFTSSDQRKLYVLDLTKTGQQNVSTIQNRTIQIIFVIYSGQPSIKVGFDENFTAFMENYDVMGTFTYLITPEVRKSLGFKGKVFVEVDAQWSTNYYFTAFTVSDLFYKITDGIAQLNEQSPSHIQNFIYESYIVIEDPKQPKQSYRIRIQVLEGNAMVGVRRCISLQKDNSLQCLITNQTQLDDPETTKTFDQIDITVRKDWSAYELIFQYDPLQCQKFKEFGNVTVYNCDFQIIVMSKQDQKKDLIYSVIMYQNREQSTLKEGYVYRDFLYSSVYHYYEFSLPDLQSIEEVTFLMTVISGDAGILGTTNKSYKYMEFKDLIEQEDVVMSYFNTLTFKKSSLANKFYLAVYSYQASQITLSVVIKRVDSTLANDTTKNNTSDTAVASTLYLAEGLSQQYTLQNTHSEVDFAFTTTKSKNLTVELIQLQGNVAFTLKKGKQGEEVKCTKGSDAGEIKCAFLAQENTKYTIIVTGDKSTAQTFSISYFGSDQCKKYPFNLPQFVYLEVSQQECSTYSVTDQQKNLQILASFSTIDLLITNVTFSVKFNENQPIEFTGREKQFPADQLKTLCKSDSMDNCNMEIRVKGDANWNVQFHFVVEQIGKQMALFDGVVRKVIDKKMTQTKGKFLYYEITSMSNSIKMFTTNRDDLTYYIAATFVDQSKFLSSPDSLYLPYRKISTHANSSENIYETELSKKGTSVIQIQPQYYSKFCTSCVMLVSIYGVKPDSDQINIFQIQVTQEQSFIYLGEQKTGFLSEDQIYVYDVYANPNGQSLLTIRDLQRQSQQSKDCFRASILEIGTHNLIDVSLGYAIIKNSTASYRFFVENLNDDICIFQITYSSMIHPVSVLNPYMPIQLKIVNSQTKYFLYKHASQDSFQVLNYVKTGDLKISANKVDTTNTIQFLINRNPESYDFKSLIGDSFLHIINKNDKFCKQCYYLLAIKGDPSVQAELALSKGEQPLGLTTYGLLKQTLKKGESQHYVFYSIFDFNISLPIIFGEVKVTVTGPKAKIIYNNSTNISKDIFVPKPVTAEGQYIDYFDENSKFNITIQALADSAYYISVRRKSITMRIYEGVPFTLSVNSEQTVVEFVNTNSNDNISILAEIKNQMPANLVFEVSASITKQNEQSISKINDPIVRRSQNSFNFIFNSIKGTYFITFKSKDPITTSIVLAKKKLTHLMSSNANLFTEKGIFQIYTPGHNLMIVIDSCLSDVEIKASEDFSAITDNPNGTETSVLLQHANFGGHYVITAQNVQGEYFVSVDSKSPKENLLYVISYYYYDKNDIMPYQKLDINPEIQYQLTNDQIIFILNPVHQLSSKNKLAFNATYTLFLSNQANLTGMNSKCNIEVGFSLSKTTNGNSEDLIKFPIDFSAINKQVGQNAGIYFVSAKVKATFSKENLNVDYPPYVDLIYNKLQMTQSNLIVEVTSETTSQAKYILFWIIIPILISSILFFLALKFCIRKYRQLYTTELIQEEVDKNVVGDSQGQMKSGHHVSDSLA